jgi:TMEM175 potassium channel family protein
MDPEPGRGGQITGLTKGRLEALTDGIFAFAMTLLVTTLDFPKPGEALPPFTLHEAFVAYFPGFFTYFLAFIILAGFWVGHHSLFHHIHSIDRTLLWTNILSLFFVALVPFSTDVVGDYPDVPLAAIIFEVNLLAIGVCLFLIWNYATTERRFVEKDLDEKTVRIHALRTLIVPFASAVGIALALLGSTWTTAIYLTIPVLSLVIRRRG